jgi:predicted GNAT family acetyltransferase
VSGYTGGAMANAISDPTIDHNAGHSRYELRIEGTVVGVANYIRSGDTVAITHTGVETALRGRGLAGELIDFALQDARRSGLKVLPHCSFVSDYIDKHREYLELVPEDRRREFGLTAQP